MSDLDYTSALDSEGRTLHGEPIAEALPAQPHLHEIELGKRKDTDLLDDEGSYAKKMRHDLEVSGELLLQHAQLAHSHAQAHSVHSQNSGQSDHTGSDDDDDDKHKMDEHGDSVSGVPVPAVASAEATAMVLQGKPRVARGINESSICEHNRRRSRCKPCGGSNLCEHGRIKAHCKDCGGVSICEHGRRRSHCKDCGGSSICEHGRRKYRCKDCGGSSFCEHGKRKSRCKDCSVPRMPVSISNGNGQHTQMAKHADLVGDVHSGLAMAMPQQAHGHLQKVDSYGSSSPTHTMTQATGLSLNPGPHGHLHVSQGGISSASLGHQLDHSQGLLSVAANAVPVTSLHSVAGNLTLHMSSHMHKDTSLTLQYAGQKDLAHASSLQIHHPGHLTHHAQAALAMSP